YASAEEMYASEQLDAVFLCVSPAHHPALAKQAFEAGVHVWMEKPAAMRAYEVEELLEKRGDLVAVVGFKKAFMPSTAKAIEIVNSAEYGNLKSMLAVYPMTIPENGREVLEGRHYVNLLANGVHPLSMLMAVGGEV